MNVQTSVGKLVATCTVVASLYLGTAWGQATNSADVTGSVTDSTGAVVPGVTVTVRDLDKNVERTYVTNEFGLYDTARSCPRTIT
jgi:Carboxypeptidase regulatory-like domain